MYLNRHHIDSSTSAYISHFSMLACAELLHTATVNAKMAYSSNLAFLMKTLMITPQVASLPRIINIMSVCVFLSIIFIDTYILYCNLYKYVHYLSFELYTHVCIFKLRRW